MDDLPEYLTRIQVAPDVSILDAVEVLNDGHVRIILIVDLQKKLLGVVTDSNVRRAILSKTDFQRPVSTIMVTSPITAKVGTEDQEIQALMERTGIHEIPLVDDEGRVSGLRLIGDVIQQYPAVHKTAVVMAGGLGTRLKPLTDEMPKPLLQVGDKPILFTLLDQLVAADFEVIYVTGNYKAGMIKEAIDQIDRYASRVRYIDETSRLGTAGALSLLPERPQEPFLVLNGDLLTKVGLDALMRFHSFERNLITMALKEERFRIPYGVATVEGTRVLSLQEKPDHLAFINAGVYVVDPVILDRIPEGRQLDMPDVIQEVLTANLRVGSFPIHEYWLDIGQPEQLETAQSEFGKYF